MGRSTRPGLLTRFTRKKSPFGNISFLYSHLIYWEVAMRRKKIQTGLAFVLIAIVVAVTAVSAINSRSARSEENTSSSVDAALNGALQEQASQAKSSGWNFGKTPPVVPLSELPPLPPPFGTGERVKADGTIQTSEDISPELQQKINELKARRMPWDKDTEEGN
jgi:hypothetical protein